MREFSALSVMYKVLKQKMTKYSLCGIIPPQQEINAKIPRRCSKLTDKIS